MALTKQRCAETIRLQIMFVGASYAYWLANEREKPNDGWVQEEVHGQEIVLIPVGIAELVCINRENGLIARKQDIVVAEPIGAQVENTVRQEGVDIRFEVFAELGPILEEPRIAVDPGPREVDW